MFLLNVPKETERQHELHYANISKIHTLRHSFVKSRMFLLSLRVLCLKIILSDATYRAMYGLYLALFYQYVLRAKRSEPCALLCNTRVCVVAMCRIWVWPQAEMHLCNLVRPDAPFIVNCDPCTEKYTYSFVSLYILVPECALFGFPRCCLSHRLWIFVQHECLICINPLIHEKVLCFNRRHLNGLNTCKCADFCVVKFFNKDVEWLCECCIIHLCMALC